MFWTEKSSVTAAIRKAHEADRERCELPQRERRRRRHQASLASMRADQRQHRLRQRQAAGQGQREMSELRAVEGGTVQQRFSYLS